MSMKKTSELSVAWQAHLRRELARIAESWGLEPSESQLDRATAAAFEALRTDGSLTDNASLEFLDLTVKAYFALHRAGVRTVGDLRALSWNNVRDIRGVGPRALRDIHDRLAARGITLRGDASLPREP